MLLGTDGYEYEDLTARLVRKKADTPYNRARQRLEDQGKTSEWLTTYGRVYWSLVAIATKTDFAVNPFVVDAQARKYTDRAFDARKGGAGQSNFGLA
jgi:hypothetical protein